jgi:hypothetical protein
MERRGVRTDLGDINRAVTAAAAQQPKASAEPELNRYAIVVDLPDRSGRAWAAPAALDPITAPVPEPTVAEPQLQPEPPAIAQAPEPEPALAPPMPEAQAPAVQAAAPAQETEPPAAVPPQQPEPEKGKPKKQGLFSSLWHSYTAKKEQKAELKRKAEAEARAAAEELKLKEKIKQHEEVEAEAMRLFNEKYNDPDIGWPHSGEYVRNHFAFRGIEYINEWRKIPDKREREMTERGAEKIQIRYLECLRILEEDKARASIKTSIDDSIMYRASKEVQHTIQQDPLEPEPQESLEKQEQKEYNGKPQEQPRKRLKM